MDSQIPEFSTGVGIMPVAWTMRACERREEANLQSSSFLCRVNEIHLVKVVDRWRVSARAEPPLLTGEKMADDREP